MNLVDLSNLHYADQCVKHPSVPDYARTRKKYSDKTANGLTTAIVDFCNLSGHFAQRTGNEGRYRPGQVVTDVIGRQRQMKGTWLPGHNNGAADVSLTMAGRIYFIEVKIGKDRQREDQVTFMNKVRNAGGVYEIVKTWEEFYRWYLHWTMKDKIKVNKIC